MSHDTTSPLSLMARMVVVDLGQTPTLWRVTAWAIEGGLARKRLETGDSTFLALEAVQRAVAQARTDATLRDELPDLVWTVDRWHGPVDRTPTMPDVVMMGATMAVRDAYRPRPGTYYGHYGV